MTVELRNMSNGSVEIGHRSSLEGMDLEAWTDDLLLCPQEIRHNPHKSQCCYMAGEALQRKQTPRCSQTFEGPLGSCPRFSIDDPSRFSDTDAALQSIHFWVNSSLQIVCQDWTVFSCFWHGASMAFYFWRKRGHRKNSRSTHQVEESKQLHVNLA